MTSIPYEYRPLEAARDHPMYLILRSSYRYTALIISLTALLRIILIIDVQTPFMYIYHILFKHWIVYIYLMQQCVHTQEQ